MAQETRSQGPSPEEWSTHRHRITDLYITKCWKLQDVQRFMKDRFGFKASEAMYRSRFKKWRIFKNLKYDQIHRMVIALSSSTAGQDFGAKHQRGLKRCMRNMKRRNRDQNTSTEGFSLRSRPLLGSSGRARNRLSNTPPEAQCHHHSIISLFADQEQYITGEGLLSMDWEDCDLPWEGFSGSTEILERLYLGPTPIIAFNAQIRSAELVLRGICHFYSPSNSSLHNSRSTSKFWDTVDHGIYLLKVGSSDRAWPLIEQACESMPGELDQNAAAFILGLLTTLSPENVSVCPGLRAQLHRFIGNMVSTKLTPLHPISVVASELLSQSPNKSASETLLLTLLSQLQHTVGPTHELSQVAQQRYTALLRRSGSYSRALCVGKHAFRLASVSQGPSHLQTRLAARQLAHVYMDIGAWLNALNICFTIVGGVDVNGLPTEFSMTDECSVSTMEDIAKIYSASGDDEKALIWLMKAARSAPMVWGGSIIAMHVLDKLQASLSKCSA